MPNRCPANLMWASLADADQRYAALVAALSRETCRRPQGESCASRRGTSVSRIVSSEHRFRENPRRGHCYFARAGGVVR